MKIAFLGAGTWGFALAQLLAGKGYYVQSWTRNQELADVLNRTGCHPRLPNVAAMGHVEVSLNIESVLKGAEFVVEAVTARGLRPVLKSFKSLIPPKRPFVITSKGIEQGSGLILPNVALEELGEDYTEQIGLLSGPGYATEVVQGLPASVVGSAFERGTMMAICETFTCRLFRVYPNSDVMGVALGGALKNVIAIACGLSEGLGFGNSAKAALMTRGLHEMRKLALALNSQSETLNGLSGMGDFFMTCSSQMSRNYRFGYLVAKGLTPEQAMDKIHMVVEGAYTCVSVMELAEKFGIPVPITENVHQILYEQMSPMEAVKNLMMRSVKEEHL